MNNNIDEIRNRIVEINSVHSKHITKDICNNVSSEILNSENNLLILSANANDNSLLTTCLNELYEVLLGEGAEIMMVTHTMKASARMSNMNKPCIPIHRALYSNPDKTLIHHKNNQFKSNCIIIQDASFVDADLFSLFLDATKNGTKIILVWDFNAIPMDKSISDLHDLFKEMIRVNKVSLITLSQN